MEDNITNSLEQAAALQKVWLDSMVGAAKVWSQYSPENPPPDELRKIRKGMLDVISASWDEYMRTPQFMELMRDSLNNTMNWQGYATEGVNRMHDVLQTASKRDVDGLLLAIRHVEKRLLDQMESLDEATASLAAKLDKRPAPTKDELAFQKSVLERLEAIEKSVSAKQHTPPPAAPKAVPVKKQTKPTPSK